MNVSSPISGEKNLIKGLQEGDRQAFESIYRSFFPGLVGFIHKHGGNVEDAKDIFQEGIMVVYRMLQKPDFHLSSPVEALMYTICRNLWFKAVRKRPYYIEIREPEDMAWPLDSDIVELITKRRKEVLFREKFKQLGEKCRSLLNLFFQGFSMKEIVSKLNLSSVSFAKKKKFQCKEKLVKLVQKDPIYIELKA